MHLRRRLVVMQHLFVLQAAEEFYLTKLLGLKAARRPQPPAKGQEMGRQHRLQNSELLDQHARDLGAAPQQPRGLVYFIARPGTRRRVAQVDDHRVEFVQQLLEPEFVGLMDDDEEHLVVMLRPRLWMLEADQFRHAQICAVCQLIRCRRDLRFRIHFDVRPYLKIAPLVPTTHPQSGATKNNLERFARALSSTFSHVAPPSVVCSNSPRSPAIHPSFGPSAGPPFASRKTTSLRFSSTPDV